MENDFGVNLKAVDIASIEPDKESEGYAELRKVTVAQTAMALEAQMNVNVKNMADMQAINATNMEETLRIQREEAQRAQRLQSETNFIGAHALDQQTSVLQTAAENLGQMGHMDGGSGGFNPAGVMTGMMLGGTMGQQMSGMMNTVGQAMNQSMNTPPPPPQVQYTLNINGQNMGPYNLQQLQQMVKDGQVNVQTYVWRQGMAGWEFAGNVQELSDLFETVPPPLTSETNEPSTM